MSGRKKKALTAPKGQWRKKKELAAQRNTQRTMESNTAEQEHVASAASSNVDKEDVEAAESEAVAARTNCHAPLEARHTRSKSQPSEATKTTNDAATVDAIEHNAERSPKQPPLVSATRQAILKTEAVLQDMSLKHVHFADMIVNGDEEQETARVSDSDEEEISFSFLRTDDTDGTDSWGDTSFQPLASSTPRASRNRPAVDGSDSDFDISEFEQEDPSILEIVQGVTAKGSRKIGKAKQAKNRAKALAADAAAVRHAASSQVDTTVSTQDSILVKFWGYEDGKSSKRILIDAKQPVLKSTFSDHTTLATVFRAIYNCDLSPEDAPVIQFKFSIPTTAKSLSSPHDYATFMQDLKKAEANAIDGPATVYLVSTELEQKLQDTAQSAGNKSKVPSELLGAASGRKKIIITNMYMRYFNRCSSHPNRMCIQAWKTKTHLPLTSIHMSSWADSMEKPPKYDDTAMPLPTETTPPLLSIFHDYWAGSEWENRYVDSRLKPPAASITVPSKSTPLRNSSDGSSEQSAVTVLDQLVTALVKRTAVPAASIVAAPRAAADPRKIMYTSIDRILQQLTEREAGEDSARDFTKYSNKFRDEEFRHIGELRDYTARQLADMFGVRLGSAQTIAAAIAAEVCNNEAAAVAAD